MKDIEYEDSVIFRHINTFFDCCVCRLVGWVGPTLVIAWVGLKILDPCTSLHIQNSLHVMETHTHTHAHVSRPFFRDYPGEPVPERQNQSGFYWSKRLVSGSGISWATCKSDCRKIEKTDRKKPSFFAGRMPFLPPNQQRQSTEGITDMCTKMTNL